MEFRHLPIAGGLFDQHPRLLEDFMVIWGAQGKHEKKKAQEAKAKANKNTSRTSRTPSAI